MKILALMFGLILSVLMAVSAYAAVVPVTIDSVEVDNFVIKDSDTTTTVRQLERGEAFEVRVELSASADAANVEVRASITGFEHSRREPIEDVTRTFDLEADESVVKKLDLTLPDRADEGKYLLRIRVSDRFNEDFTQTYGIKIEPTDTNIVIRNFELSPEEEVQAGRAILATVRVKNLGDSEEDDVKIKVTIPDLGVSATPDFIDNLDSDDSATSEEFFLKIDRCTRPGVYDVVATVTFDQGDEKTTESKVITVTKGVCDVPTTQPGQTQVSGKTTIAYSTETQSVSAGSSATYPITITNSGTSTKAFTLSVDGADWASFSISPSNLVTIRSGTTQTVFVSATANAGVQAGQRVFTVSVKDTAGNVLQNLALKADVAASGSGVGDLSGLRNALTAGLVVIVAVLVVIGLLLAFRRRGGEDGESQTYY